MNKKEHMISDIDKRIDIIYKDLNRAKRGLKELKEYYHNDPDITEECLYVLHGEMLVMYRNVGRIADTPALYQSDMNILDKTYKKDPQE